MIARIFKGHILDICGTEFTVMGSNSIRGKYYYILSRKMDGQKGSIRRDVVMKLQAIGTIKVLQ